MKADAWDNTRSQCKEQEDLHPNGYWTHGFCRPGKGVLIHTVWIW